MYSFYVGINALTLAINRQFSISAAGSRGAGGIKQTITHNLANQADILLIIVKGQIG